MSTITAPHSPSSHLTTPTVQGGGSEIAKLRDKCGMIIGGVDEFIESITHFSPLQEWVFKPLAGDWDALDRGAVAWHNAGKAVNDVAQNIDSLPDQVAQIWEGASAKEFANTQTKLANALKPLPDACDSMGAYCSGLADMARAIAEFVVGVMNGLFEFATEMIAALAVPIAGEASMPLWMGELGVKIAIWVPKLAKDIEEFMKFVEEIFEIVKEVQKILSIIQKMESALSSIAAVTSAIVGANAADNKATVAATRAA